MAGNRTHVYVAFSKSSRDKSRSNDAKRQSIELRAARAHKRATVGGAR